MIIREERPADHPALRALLEAAFGGPAEADLVDALRRDGDIAIALVAELEEGPAGHLVLSRMRAPPGTLGLAPLAVKPSRQGSGLGSALVEAGLARACSEGWQGVFVLGEPAFYGRFGFTAAQAAPFRSPFSGPFLQALELRPGALAAKEPEAAYAAAFAAFE
ncbi:N-acetyltransferase [Geminicoccaceae bacterium 1502E]|nr:N-acetyltransferase [Geminicoccaceae bacterium 1502E]